MRDKFGQEIREGDYVLRAAKRGNSPWMQMYRVTKVRGPSELEAVGADDWHHEWRVFREGRPVILSRLGQTIVIPKSLVPSSVREVIG